MSKYNFLKSPQHSYPISYTALRNLIRIELNQSFISMNLAEQGWVTIDWYPLEWPDPKILDLLEDLREACDKPTGGKTYQIQKGVLVNITEEMRGLNG
jgi:hypothetical protein